MQTALFKFFAHGDPRLSRLGYFLAAVVLHLVLFVLLATYVIFKAPPPPANPDFLKIAIARTPPAPPTPPAAAAGGMTANALEPDVTVTPPPVPPAMITSVASTFSVNSVSVKLPTLASLSEQATGTAMAGTGTSGSGSGSGSPFGSATGSGSALFQGYLYDLKQTADRKPTGMTSDIYRTNLLKLLTSGWDPSVLAPFYRCPKPVFTSQILVPDIDANEGPKAFNAQGEVDPKLWIVWYKARLSPPESGVYRFAGFADDILLVRVDGETVLDGSIVGVSPSLIRHTPWPNDWVENRLPDQNYGQLREGTPVNLTKGLDVDIDVIIGEDPGGQFNASLFAVRDGIDYPTTKAGAPMLPLLQAGSTVTQFDGVHPPVSPKAEPWSP